MSLTPPHLTSVPQFRDEVSFSFFFFNDTATTEIYTLSLHDALPISTCPSASTTSRASTWVAVTPYLRQCGPPAFSRSEEHTSELQSQSNLVCRLLLEKKKKKYHQKCGSAVGYAM